MTIRRFLLALVGLALAVGAYGLGTYAATPDADAVVGTFDVPMGTVTVYGDHSARYQPTTVPSPFTMGMCDTDTMNDTTGVQYDQPVHLCAPAFAPDGHPVGVLDTSDGWALYPGSAWAYDGWAVRFVPTSAAPTPIQD